MSIEADQTHASRARRTLLRTALLTGAAMMAPGTAAMAKDLRPASAASGDLSKGTAQLTLGMVVFDGFQLLDVFGPLDMFGNLEGKVRIVILGERAGVVASSAGPAVAVDHALDAAPHIDILMVPGGMGTRREVGNAALIAGITGLARSAPHVASICTGAALLARTGLLDGRRATTNKRLQLGNDAGAKSRVGEASALGGGRPCVHLLRRLRGYGHGAGPDRKTVRPRCRQAGRRHRGVQLECGFHQ